MAKKKADKAPLHEINWYADKYQSVVVWSGWLFLITVLALAGVIVTQFSASHIYPLKSVEPFVVQIDEKSGAVELVESRSLKEYSANEALLRHFAVSYIQARERYNFYTFKEDINQVRVMSDRDVMFSYRQEISPDNPQSPLNKFGTTMERRLYTKSFTFLNKNTSLGQSQVQATMIVQEIGQGRMPQQYVMTVTLTCVFDPNFVPGDEDRILNPLGFKVVAYRTDKDIAILGKS